MASSQESIRMTLWKSPLQQESVPSWQNPMVYFYSNRRELINKQFKSTRTESEDRHGEYVTGTIWTDGHFNRLPAGFRWKGGIVQKDTA